jgi:hypothetical protein
LPPISASISPRSRSDGCAALQGDVVHGDHGREPVVAVDRVAVDPEGALRLAGFTSDHLQVVHAFAVHRPPQGEMVGRQPAAVEVEEFHSLRPLFDRNAVQQRAQQVARCLVAQHHPPAGIAAQHRDVEAVEQGVQRLVLFLQLVAGEDFSFHLHGPRA